MINLNQVSDKFVNFLLPTTTQNAPHEQVKLANYLDIAKRAFHTRPLFNQQLNKDGSYLPTFINELLETYSDGFSEYYAPYTTIVQSSGMGKTRMLQILDQSRVCLSTEQLYKQEADVEYCVVYCNFNTSNDVFPGRTKNFADFLCPISSVSQTDYESRVHHYFAEFIKFIDDQKQKPNLFNDCECKQGHGDCARCHLWKVKFSSFSTKTASKYSAITRSREKAKKRIIVFAFDEARGLTTNFTENGYFLFCLFNHSYLITINNLF